MEKLQLKIGLTDLVYSITVHSFHIFLDRHWASVDR